MPAGGDVADPAVNPKFAHKLAFVAEATNWFAARRLERCILVGDLNIAPLEHDVWSHKQLLTVVSHTPIEVEHLNAWLRTGFADAMRHFVPADEKLYTWWSYRNQDWRRSNRGRRLDHVWVTPDLVPGLRQHGGAGRRPRLGARHPTTCRFASNWRFRSEGGIPLTTRPELYRRLHAPHRSIPCRKTCCSCPRARPPP